MMYKNCNINDIESIRERADARGTALCLDKLIWASLGNIDGDKVADVVRRLKRQEGPIQ